MTRPTLLIRIILETLIRPSQLLPRIRLLLQLALVRYLLHLCLVVPAASTAWCGLLVFGSRGVVALLVGAWRALASA